MTVCDLQASLQQAAHDRQTLIIAFPPPKASQLNKLAAHFELAPCSA